MWSRTYISPEVSQVLPNVLISASSSACAKGGWPGCSPGSLAALLVSWITAPEPSAGPAMCMLVLQYTNATVASAQSTSAEPRTCHCCPNELIRAPPKHCGQAMWYRLHVKRFEALEQAAFRLHWLRGLCFFRLHLASLR